MGTDLWIFESGYNPRNLTASDGAVQVRPVALDAFLKTMPAAHARYFEFLERRLCQYNGGRCVPLFEDETAPQYTIFPDGTRKKMVLLNKRNSAGTVFIWVAEHKGCLACRVDQRKNVSGPQRFENFWFPVGNGEGEDDAYRFKFGGSLQCIIESVDLEAETPTCTRRECARDPHPNGKRNVLYSTRFVEPLLNIFPRAFNSVCRAKKVKASRLVMMRCEAKWRALWHRTAARLYAPGGEIAKRAEKRFEECVMVL